MLDTEIIADAPVQETEPVEAQDTPVTDESLETADTPVKDADKSTEASADVETEAKADDSSVSEDDDPFAEFEKDVPKDEAYYDNLFKTEKWKHVPHTARDEIRTLVKEREETKAVLEAIGGQPMIDTFKPVSAAILNPNVTPEEVEAAFDAIANHNPKIIDELGVTFTKNWVQGVVSDPVTHLSPLIQHVLGQSFGQAGTQYDLSRIMEFVQLDIARDGDGDPILDLDAARQLFELNGGVPTFKYQQEKAAYERRIQELQNGYQQTSATPTQASQPVMDIDADLEKEILPKAESVLTKLGYKQDDPEFNLYMDAMRYRLITATETERIRGFAKNGAYKTADGKYVQGVENNRNYLSNRLYAQLINEMKAVQSKRKGSTPSAPKPLEKKPAPTQNGTPPPSFSQAPNRDKILRGEDVIAQTVKDFKARIADENAAAAIAAGR